MGTELEFTEGMQFDKGYISQYFVTDAERMETVLEETCSRWSRTASSSTRSSKPTTCSATA